MGGVCWPGKRRELGLNGAGRERGGVVELPHLMSCGSAGLVRDPAAAQREFTALSPIIWGIYSALTLI